MTTPGDGLRIDKWLWFTRFCKSRSLAQHLVEEGLVRLNDRPVGKASVAVLPGDRVTLRTARAWRCVRVVALGSRRGPAVEATTLYVDVTPAGDWQPPFQDEDE